MDEILTFDTVKQYSAFNRQETRHPLVGLLDLSPNYFGDLVKKDTGRWPQDHIQLRVVELAKERLFDPGRSVSEIAYGLGFKYPQHFSRMFKKTTGMTPMEFRNNQGG